jgi:hypothetical protein
MMFCVLYVASLRHVSSGREVNQNDLPIVELLLESLADDP